MYNNWFYAPENDGKHCFLPEDESLHCAKVLRLRENDGLMVTDGRGSIFSCVLESVHPKQCLARIEEVIQSPESPGKALPNMVHLLMAPTKNMERTEWFLEKACEVGVGRVSFLNCRRSERTKINMERLKKIAVSAMKQSKQAWLPVLEPMQDFTTYMNTLSPLVNETSETSSAQRYIAYCGEEYPKQELAKLSDVRFPVEILIGPEGDFSPEEIALALKKSYLPVSLGDTRLRTETAALYAVWVFAFKKQCM